MTAWQGSEGMKILATRLGMMPAELRPRVRAALKVSGESMRSRAAAQATWSTRIPKALKTRTRFAGSRPGVWVAASRNIAPHARPYEGITGNATFRHPTLDPEKWVTQSTRPFLVPAVEATNDEAIRAAIDALDGAVRAAGFG